MTRWRKDFPVRWDEDNYMTRRELAKFLTLGSGLLAGVNPVFGLYAYLIGLTVGSLSTSSALMSVESTSAMAVIISDVPAIANRNSRLAITRMRKSVQETGPDWRTTCE